MTDVDVLTRAEQAQAKVASLEQQLQAALAERKQVVKEASAQHSYTQVGQRIKLSRQRTRNIVVGNPAKKKARPSRIEL